MTKQLGLMMVLTALGTLGVYLVSPFWGVAIYYLFAILRPQFIWDWALPEAQWSFYVAMVTLSAAALSLVNAMPDTRPPAPARPTFGRGHYAMFLFAGWIGITYVLAQNSDVAYEWTLEYAKIFIMFGAAAILIRTHDEIKRLLLLTGVVIAYLSLEINVDYLMTGQIKILKHGHCGLDNNGAGLMLAMGLPVCYFVFEGITSRWRWLLVGCIPLIVHAVLMTYSRGAMVALALTTPLIVLRSRYRFWASGLLLIGGAIALPTMAGPEIRARFFSIESAAEVDGSAQARFMSWTAALRIANDYPIFGVGVRNANLFSRQYGADMEGRTIHSQYLQVAADNGYVGLALFLLLLLTTWRELRAVRQTAMDRDNPDHRLNRAMANAIESSLTIFCIGGLFLSLEVFELPYLLMLLAAQLGLFAHANRPDFQPAWTPAVVAQDAGVPA